MIGDVVAGNWFGGSWSVKFAILFDFVRVGVIKFLPYHGLGKRSDVQTSYIKKVQMRNQILVGQLLYLSPGRGGGYSRKF